MLLGASARNAALDFPFQAEFYMPSFLNLKADIYQMSCQVPKDILKDIHKILCIVKELFLAFRKPLASTN